MSDETANMQRGWKSCPSAIGAIWVPSGWTEESVGNAATAYVGKERPSTEFRENIVLSVIDSAGSLVDDSSAAVSEALRMEPWSHVISVSPWSHGIFRRRMQFIYEHDGFSVAVSKFTATSSRGRIDLTCSAGFERYYDLSRVFDEIATFSPLEGADVDNLD
ncbi:hypothetical protein [Clavibacter sp. VKM Ac-2872]|uniref:hypothetical protein n=1 Tax=Clavibacter sp. VKM Ac-2872 TaxID=2783812 RepID=UPI00188DA2C9|nr:hypothetical protein [Clavibacter sp. VKM Ac-2872]MBF4624112.1 hypothetical protein [Clavibacter sp. VKM Ac-2872]